MPRTYGTTNVAPYASAPAVGQIGDEYYNTASKILYLSDGSVWNPVSGQSAPYAPVVGTPPNASAPVTSPPTGLLWVDTSTNPAWSPSLVGPGVPPGGGTGTYLQKRSATDYDTVWAGPSSLFYYQTISAPSAGSSTTVSHNLGTRYIQVQLWDAVTGLLVAAQVQVVNANTIQISVTQAMPNNVNVVVMGTTNLVPPVNPADVASKSYVDARTPNLPAPVVSGSGVQSFTDVLGQMWVALNGVIGGAWRLARDVMHAHWYRAAAYTIPISAAVPVPFDTVDRDPYGLFNVATSIYTVPITGIWRFFGQIAHSPNSATDFCNLMLRQNGTRICQNQAHASSTSANTYPRIEISEYVNAGDQFYFECYKLGATAVMNIGALNSYCGLDYMGTG
jgi:hypothetical protein